MHEAKIIFFLCLQFIAINCFAENDKEKFQQLIQKRWASGYRIDINENFKQGEHCYRWITMLRCVTM